MTRETTTQVTTIGIDIGENTFHLIGLDADRKIVVRRKFSRRRMMVRLSNIPPCLSDRLSFGLSTPLLVPLLRHFRVAQRSPRRYPPYRCAK